PDPQDRLGEELGSAVAEVVATDLCQDDVAQAPPTHRFGDTRRFGSVDPAARPVRRDRAERATTRAVRSKEHQRRGPPRPAFGEVRAPRLAAHGPESEFTQEV